MIKIELKGVKDDIEQIMIVLIILNVFEICIC